MAVQGSDIAASKETDVKPTGVAAIAHTLGTDSPTDTYESDFVIFRLANTKKKGRVHISGTGDFLNPETKVVERARLLSGVPSIWMKDQKDLDKEFVRTNLRSLIFDGRVCRLRKEDKQGIQYARLTNSYIDDPSKNTGGMYAYFEWNPQRQAEAALAKRKEKITAMRQAMDAPMDKVKKHALYLGIHAVDELGVAKRDDAIRDEYVMKAEENPTTFMQTFDSLVVDVAYLVRKAIIDTKIDLGREARKAYWATGKFICSLPSNRNAKDVLVEFATTPSAEGREFLDQLQALGQS